MRSQLRFVMHPDDEREFAAQILSEADVFLIDGPRWKSATPALFRSLDAIAGDYCILWSTQDRASLESRYMAKCDDWYCESEQATIQFLRSQVFGPCLTEGRIAVGTTGADESEAAGVERRFKALARFIKKHYSNAVLCWRNPTLPFAPAGPGRSANPGKPDAQVWVGPHALRWLRQEQGRNVKQSAGALVEARLVTPDDQRSVA